MREEIARLRDEGLSYGQIAKQLNISRNVVAGLLKRMKYPKSGKLRPYKPRSPKPVKKETPAAVVSAPGKRKKLSRLCFLHHWY